MLKNNGQLPQAYQMIEEDFQGAWAGSLCKKPILIQSRIYELLGERVWREEIGSHFRIRGAVT